MNLWRIFANAIVRRVAYVLVAMALAWLGLGEARADDHPDQGSAYAHCLQQAAAAKPARPDLITDTRCVHWTNGSPFYQCEARTYEWFSCRQVVGSGEYFHNYGTGQTCANRPSQVTQFLPLSGSTQCYNGCVVTYRQNGDDETSTRSTTGATCTTTKDLCTVGFFFNSMMGVCQPIEPDCPEGQEKVDGVCKPENKCPEGYVAVQGSTPGAIQQGALYCKKADNECPAGNVKSPEGNCLPGEGQCAAGEARRENGTCGKDANGDGKADDDDDDNTNDPKKSFSGGDSCDAPPSCNGDPIMCGQARIQWRIDCNTRRNVNISGGTCSNVPICTGKDCKAMEYSQLLMQWRAACALEKMAGGDGSTGGGDADLAAIKNALTGSQLVDGGPEGTPDGAFSDNPSDPDELDDTGFGFSRSCPQIPPVSVMGQSINFDISIMCSWVALGGQLVLILAALLSLRILSSGSSA